MRSPSLLLPFGLLCLLLSNFAQAQHGVSISDDASRQPHVSAILDIGSTTQGVLWPHLTTTERNALSAAAATGLMIYEDNGMVQRPVFYNGTEWIPMTSLWLEDGSNIVYNQGHVGVGDGITPGSNPPLSALHVDGAQGGELFRVSVLDRDANGTRDVVDDAMVLDAGLDNAPTKLTVNARIGMASIEARNTAGGSGIALISSFSSSGNPGLTYTGLTAKRIEFLTPSIQPKTNGATDLGSVGHYWGDYYVRSNYEMTQEGTANGAIFRVILGNMGDNASHKGRGFTILPPTSIATGYATAHYLSVGNNADQTLFTVGPNGHLGIAIGGTLNQPNSPTQALDVNGNIRMRSGAAVDYIPVSNAAGVMTWKSPTEVGALVNAGYWTNTGGLLENGSGTNVKITATAFNIDAPSIFEQGLFAEQDITLGNDRKLRSNNTSNSSFIKFVGSENKVRIHRAHFSTGIWLTDNSAVRWENGNTDIFYVDHQALDDAPHGLRMETTIVTDNDLGAPDLQDRKSMDIRFGTNTGTDQLGDKLTISAGSNSANAAGNSNNGLVSNIVTVTDEARVGINENDPETALDVNGTMRIQVQGAPANPVLGETYFDGADLFIWAWDNTTNQTAQWKQITN